MNNIFLTTLGLNKENNILRRVPDGFDKIWKRHELQGLADYFLFLAAEKFGKEISCAVIVANRNKNFNVYTLCDYTFRRGTVGMKDAKKMAGICNREGIPCFLIEEVKTGEYRIITTEK